MCCLFFVSYLTISFTRKIPNKNKKFIELYGKNLAIKCPCLGLNILLGFYSLADFYKIPVQSLQNQASEYTTVDGH